MNKFFAILFYIVLLFKFRFNNERITTFLDYVTKSQHHYDNKDLDDLK